MELRKVMRAFLNMLIVIPVRCTNCGLNEISRGDFDGYFESNYSKGVVFYRATDIDCPWAGPSDQLDDHCAQCPFVRMPFIPQSLMHENAAQRQQLKQIEYEKDRLLILEQKIT